MTDGPKTATEVREQAAAHHARMTRDEWASALRPDVSWTVAYPIVEREVRRHLTGCMTCGALSTAELVERLHPWPGGAKARIFRALSVLAVRELADCCFRGPGRTTRFKNQVRPWIWHPPGAPHIEAVIMPAPYAKLEAELLAYVASYGRAAALDVIGRVIERYWESPTD